MLNLKFISSLILAVLMSAVIFAQNPLLNENSIKFEDAQTVTLVGEDGLIMRSTNNGINWNELNSNISNNLSGLSVHDGIMLAAGENGVILRSADNGDTWLPILPGTLENLNDAEIHGNNAVVCGNNGIIYYSQDAGINWQESPVNTTHNLLDINFINTYTGFITGENGTLLKTTDGGVTWAESNLSFTNAKFNSIEAIDENRLIVVGDMGKAFLSIDGGITWYGPSGVMYENNFNDVVFFDEFNGCIAADDGLMLRTTDGGESWESATVNASGTLYDFKSVAFSDLNSGISVGSEGVEIYTIDGGATWFENGEIMNSITGKKTARILTSKNFPNPFNPTTNISYELPFDADVTVKVFDITGKEVASLFSGYQAKGNHSVIFNAWNLSSGVYFYRIDVSSLYTGFTDVKKMILAK